MRIFRLAFFKGHYTPAHPNLEMEIMRSPEQQQPNSIPSNTHEHASLDENLYSRQLYVLGADGMKKMLQSDVLVIGLDGLGVEISKNIALAGVRSLTLWDAQVAQIEDLCSNFYLSTNDLGKSRAAACRSKLDELNPYVPVRLLESAELSFEAISSQFHVIIAANMPIQQQCLLDALCHQKGNVFIGAQVAGVFGHVFCDFGPEFTLLDGDGEPCASGIISSITTDDSQGIVTCLEETKHNLEDGQWVRFREVKGMIGLNWEDEENNEDSSSRLRQITVISPHSFSIGSTVGFGGDYSGGGIFEQVKRPQTLNFIPMEQSLKNPSFVTSDFAKIEHQTLILGLFEALGAFQEKHRKFPQLPEDFPQFSTLLSAASCILNSTMSPRELKDLLERDEIKKLVTQFIAGSSCLVAPMASVIGGLAAQEALKACTAKFTPIKQHFVFDAVEALPPISSYNSANQNASIFSSQNASHSTNQVSASRYAPLVRLFGEELCQRLFNYRQFLVGSGAIGCEMLKNWALLGLGTGPNGSITVTDMDTIEKSNLNRQFLFRPSDLSLPKSEVAAAAVLAINPDLSGHIHPFVERVAVETEETFNCKFFQQIDCVTNALDNVAAREYMDKRCVLFEKPLLESGTLGTKGNVQVVIPHLTESYSSSQDPPEKSIPSCTIRNFPSQIEHTINWALDFFKGTFTAQPESVKAYLEDPKAFLETLTKGGESTASQRETLEQIHALLIGERPRSFEDCIRWARMKFEELFRNNILQLLHSFPPDATTSTGMPFWSGSKRCPVALEFNPEDPLHLSFIESASHLRAFLYGIPPPNDFKFSSDGSHKSFESQSSSDGRHKSLIKTICSQMTFPPFQPSSRIRAPPTHDQQSDSPNSSIESSSSSSNHSDEDDAKAIQNLLSILPQSISPNTHSNDNHAFSQIRACQFEKDDDSNWHIDFIAAAANLRATNYSIPAAERLKIKQIAGKIIPAIATTTSLIVGLVCLEMIKLIGLSNVGVLEQHSLSDPSQASQKRSLFKNGFVNLALPFFAFSEPLAPLSIKWREHCWTLWDSIKLKGPLTLQALIDHFSRAYGLSISIISWGPCMIWNCFGQMPKAKLEERLGMELGALCTMISKKPLPPREVCDFLQLNVLASGSCLQGEGEEDEIDVDVPVVLYQLPQ